MYLLQRGADVNAEDDTGLTSMLYATRKGHFAVVRLLLDYGANGFSRGSSMRRLHEAPSFGPPVLQGHTWHQVNDGGRSKSALGWLGPTAGGGGGMGMERHALHTSGAHTLHGGGTAFSANYSLPAIGKPRGKSAGGAGAGPLSVAHLNANLQHRVSHGEPEYQRAKAKLLDQIFGESPCRAPHCTHVCSRARRARQHADSGTGRARVGAPRCETFGAHKT